MMPCDDLLSFAEGELDRERTAVFRDHLQTCPVCPGRLVEAVQLGARLSERTPTSRR
ncbi:MAG: zf-HC2 domain-containing protein [Deltaproteobacteria bacterium]|nr:MAG: zf-HC2 domain-containing protein [Deltaproteobacteria bacterium]TMQ23299.1 MAG: zf-HC2 domain-containing protein [Deltaproteobacteria bacterium]